jgi:hypothetical protein
VTSPAAVVSGDRAGCRLRYASTTMSKAANFADPDFEPTDEQLQELSREAFANVRAQQEHTLAQLRTSIRSRTAEAMKRLQQRRAPK